MKGNDVRMKANSTSVSWLGNVSPIGLVGMVALTLQGCGAKVDCNNDKTKATAIEIIQSQLSNAVWYREIGTALSGTPELTNIKTLTRNDELKKAECSAQYSFTYNAKARQIDVRYDLAYLQDKGAAEVKVVVDDVKSGLIGLVMKERPVKNGTEKVLDPKTGNLQHSIQWKNGVQDGPEEFYNQTNGKLIAQINFVGGKKNGAEKHWSSDGSTLLVDLNWADEKATGYEKQLDMDGKVRVDLTWKDGKETGFLADGALSQPHTESHFKDGLLDGVKKVYVNDHSAPYALYLYKVENYKGGKIDGPVQYFRPDGTSYFE